MVWAILFADTPSFKFERESYILVGYVFGFTVLIFLWFVKYIALGVYSEYYNIWTLILKGLEMFTISIPPALPLCLTIGLQLANKWLIKK